VPNWQSLRVVELLTAAALCSLGVAVLVATSRMRIGFAAAFQPKLFPALVGWLLIVSAAALGLTALRTPPAISVDWPERSGARRVAVMLGSIAAFLTAIDVIGMPLATVLVVWFQVWLLGRYRPYVPIAVALISGVVVDVVFSRGIGLMFPAGVFGQ
jgi:putative tricarboxylic transport membrane protein